jgi:hypothetical protein
LVQSGANRSLKEAEPQRRNVLTRVRHLMRVALVPPIALAVAVIFGSPQPGHAGTTADISSCAGALNDACAYDIYANRSGCLANAAPSALRPECASADIQPRHAEKQIFASLCASPLCLGAEPPVAQRTGDVLLGAALPLLLGSLALIGAMGIRPRA